MSRNCVEVLNLGSKDVFMKILFLHGWRSKVGGIKPTFLRGRGHEVINTALDHNDFAAAVRTAQSEYDLHKPDVIVGSSRGGAVAMNIQSGQTPLVLLCPAWKKWGTATTVKSNTVILHSYNDEEVSFEDSEELVENSGLSDEALRETGNDHLLADAESLERMLDACWDDQYHSIHESSHAVIALLLSLIPKTISIGITDTGTSGGITFCSQDELNSDSWRFLSILVAGRVGTSLCGYGNSLVSEKLELLEFGAEPGWMSDEFRVWDREYLPDEIKTAENEVEKMLLKHNTVLIELANTLLEKRELETEEILAIFRNSTSKY